MKLSSSPFSFRGEGYLGKIYRPYIEVLISSLKIKEWIPVEMIVDTGADYTLLPKRYAELLNISVLKECRLEKTYGVGGQETIYLCKKLVKMRISKFNSVIAVGFLDRDNIPALLGRLGAIEALTLIMKNQITTLES